MKKYFLLIISLLICFKLTAAEIEIISDKPGDGKKIIYHSWVQVEYTGSFENGEVFDSSKDGSPLPFVLGQGQIIPGFENAVAGMKIGDKKDLVIKPEDAYGTYSDDKIIKTDFFDRVQ